MRRHACDPYPPSLMALHKNSAMSSMPALGATYRVRSWITTLLAELGWRNRDGKRYTGEQVRTTLEALAAAGQVVEHPQRQGGWRAPRHHSATYLALLQRAPANTPARRPAERGQQPLRRPLRHGLLAFRHHGTRLRRHAAGGVQRAGRASAGAAPPGLPLGHGMGRRAGACARRARRSPLRPDAPAAAGRALRENLILLNLHWVNPGHLPLLAMTEDLRRRALADPALAAVVRLTTLPARASRAPDAGRALRRGGARTGNHAPPGDADLDAGLPVWRAVAASYEAVHRFRSGDWAGCIAGVDAVQEVMRTLSGKRKALVSPSVGFSYVLAHCWPMPGRRPCRRHSSSARPKAASASPCWRPPGACSHWRSR